MLREFFLGFIQIHILHHAAQAPLYGAAMMAELRRHGYEISPGTLYPLLHSLEEQGYLASSRRVVGGRVRKYYAATKAGKQALDETLPKLRELVDEVLEGRGPTSLPDPLNESEEP
jgi:PadR family transcriptional regulator, regulatory protein PadR